MKAVTTAQIRQLDQRTIATGVASAELMERAGAAVARACTGLLHSHAARSVLLFAGKGNNGGDAIVAARHLANMGCQPTLILLCRRDELQGDPLKHFQRLIKGVHVFELPAAKQMREIVTEVRPVVIIDGLLGTGLTGAVREPYLSAISFINELGRPVVAIDIPSGIDSDPGKVRGVCVRADVTVTMGLPKIGLLQPAAVDYVGRIEVADIGFPQQFVGGIKTTVELISAGDVAPMFPARQRTAHKGDFGHLLIVAGSEGYTGAPVLCAHAAARSGVGLVTLAVPRAIYPIIAANCPPEIMPQPVDGVPDTTGFDAMAVGPGLGQGADTQNMVRELIRHSTVPLVLDADALNVLARDLSVLKKASAPIVVTPHPGEMGRLIGKTANAVQAHRWEIAKHFARKYGVVTVLKGAGTVVTDKSGKLWINATGNPGMAKGGMGDVLTGMIGAFLAQGLSPLDAARAGVFLHGSAGDIARERHGEQALLASDLILSLGAAFAELVLSQS
jgi:NAD(P)H-hydrate epimerase